jgi:hypothetical protein
MDVSLIFRVQRKAELSGIPDVVGADPKKEKDASPYKLVTRS